MPWERRFFKNNKQKVWVEVDEQGELMSDAKGLVPMRYTVEDEDRTYSAHPRSIGAKVDASAAPTPGPSSASATPATPPLSAAQQQAQDTALAAAGELIVSTDLPEDLAQEPPPEEGTIEVYTDGACQGNPGPCSYGVVIRYGPHYKELSQYLGQGTNNIAELTAILVALESLKRKDIPVRVHTDSSYAIGVITQNWKAKANKELITSLRQIAAQFHDLELIKVKGHAGVPLNERVDQLAVAAIETQRALAR